MTSEDNKRNVADYKTVKSVIYEYWYDFVETVTTLQNPRLEGRDQERGRYMQQLRADLTGLYAHAYPSRNIDVKTAEEIKNVRDNLWEYQDQDKLLSDLDYLLTSLAESMGDQGFLDTRFDPDQNTGGFSHRQ